MRSPLFTHRNFRAACIRVVICLLIAQPLSSSDLIAGGFSDCFHAVSEWGARVRYASQRQQFRRAVIDDDRSFRDEILRTKGFPDRKQQDQVRGQIWVVNTKDMIRRVTNFVLQFADYSPLEKALAWASLIDNRSVYYAHFGSDGSYVFLGSNGFALIFRPDGKVFKGRDIYLPNSDAVWQAHYEGLTELDPNWKPSVIQPLDPVLR